MSELTSVPWNYASRNVNLAHADFIIEVILTAVDKIALVQAIVRDIYHIFLDNSSSA